MNQRLYSANVSRSKSTPPRGLFIDGREQPSGDRESFPIHSPATGEVIAHTVNASDADVDAAIASARRAFEGDDWRKMSNRTRAKLVYALGDALEKHLDELYELESLNNGRPTRETRAQLGMVSDLFRYNAGLALAKRDATIPGEGDYLGYTLRRPVGVVANVTPFNHPLLIASRNLAPTFASGCTTVVKPSEYTPLTTLRVAEIFSAAGLPPGVFNIVTGFGATTGKALSSHPGINKLVLTGGTESGRLAGAAAARNFAHQTLELGGKAPVIVFDDFDLDQAVDYAAFGAFIGAGQTCVCASRHLVQRSVYDAFVDKLAAKARAIKVGDPFDGTTQMGPLISERQRRSVLDFVEIGSQEGARLVAGGRVPMHLSNSGGFYVEPTVFADVTPQMRIA
jgi:acyl-CoA reductase-like NAD-dependent aldehyde dehydrogenase